ncbi:MAG TPA: response regulator [Verrucomicrobiae bacterium]
MATLNVASSLKKSVRPDVYSEIWIAEDNTDVRIFLQRAFRNSEPSPNLVFFRNGAELVEHFHEHSPLPRLLLLDMEMPVMNGLTALSCIGADEYSAQTPVVIFSSLENPEIVRQAYRSGAKLYLKKPARLEGFSDVAELCVHCAEAIRALPSGRLPLAAFEAKEVLQLLSRAVPRQGVVGRSRAGNWS